MIGHAGPARGPLLALALLALLPVWALAVADAPPARAGVMCPPLCTPQSTQISVTMDAGPDPVISGGLLNYQITITNNAATVATDVALYDRLPLGALINVQTGSTQGSCAITVDNVVCSLGVIFPGQSAQVFISGNVSAPPGATLLNRLTVRATLGGQRVEVDKNTYITVTTGAN
jgi:uncharacterized repeat protein (TIGR01451 family)